MIVIYPMLTSNMSGHVIPGVCKVLEKYLLVYKLDEILKTAGVLSLIKVVRGRMAFKEGVNVEILEENGYFQEHMKLMLSEERRKNQDGNKNQNQSKGDKKPGYKVTADFKAGKTDVFIPDQNGLSLEPTWVKIDSATGTKLIGVKVIPFPVKSQSSLAKALIDDMVTKKLQTAAKKVLRTSVNLLHSLYRGLRLDKLFPNINLSGNPTRDIVYGATTYGRNVFALINQADITNDEDFSNVKKIDKLFFLKWNTFVIADDVKKQINFCTKEFKGLCSTVLYSYLFSSLGKDQSKVFDTLEDVKQTTSPFFRRKSRMSDILTDSLAYRKISKYSFDPIITEAKATVYDQVQLHLKKAKTSDDAKRHIETILIWLFKKKLLNSKGIKMIKQGMDKKTSITSDMLLPKGVKIMDQCYKAWASKAKYQKKIDTKILDQCSKGVR